MATKTKKKNSKVRGREEILGTLFAGIPVIGFISFSLLPIVIAFWMSFHKVVGYSMHSASWIGLKNYEDILFGKYTDFWLSLKNTLYAMTSVVLSLIGSLLVAAVLNHCKLGTKVFRIIFFLPYACSVVAITSVWKWMFDYNYGILNSIVVSLGFERVPWLIDSSTFMPSMIMMNVWSGMGYGIILFGAALTNIPKSILEAATIDGSGVVRTFFAITLPCISPTTFFLLSMGIINGMQSFAAFQVMAPDGGPDSAGLTSVFYIWRMVNGNLFTEGMGKACAGSLILALLIAGLVTLNFKLQKLWVHYD